MKNTPKIYLFTWLIVLATLSSFAQPKYKPVKSVISFFSSTPVEDISATTKQARFLVDLKTNSLAVVIPIKSFEFPQKLMQEHFNENYMESDKFPKATFKGKIIGKLDLSLQRQVFNIEGVFNIHGVDVPKTVKAFFNNSDGNMTIETDFDIVLASHNIKIPTLLFTKIATVIKVKAIFELLRDDLGFIQLGTL
jgi:hypothetical protein